MNRTIPLRRDKPDNPKQKFNFEFKIDMVQYLQQNGYLSEAGKDYFLVRMDAKLRELEPKETKEDKTK